MSLKENNILLETTCILCPNGCELKLLKAENTDLYKVVGNKCPKGENFAIDEYIAPKRMVTSTVKTIYKNRPRLPVKTAQPIPKDAIFQVMNIINHIVVDHQVNQGDILIKNIGQLNISLIATSTISDDEI